MRGIPTGNSVAVAAWHLMRKTAIDHPPKVMLWVGGFFVGYALFAKWQQGGRWLSKIFLSLFLTLLLSFIVACLYVITRHAGLKIF